MEVARCSVVDVDCGGDKVWQRELSMGERATFTAGVGAFAATAEGKEALLATFELESWLDGAVYSTKTVVTTATTSAIVAAAATMIQQKKPSCRRFCHCRGDLIH